MARKRAATSTEIAEEEPKRRTSSRLRGSAAPIPGSKEPITRRPTLEPKKEEAAASDISTDEKPKKKPAGKRATKAVKEEKEKLTKTCSSSNPDNQDLDPDSLPDVNPEVERHQGEWYWLMKAEPETRYEDGIDVRFAIDDLRAKTKPEPWDGIRNYAARNNLKAMNHGDKAFFYHSNTKEPGIVGIMEVVKEYSEDVSARRPGTAYYDPQSTKEKPRWGLVHVRFIKKFAVQISLQELRELGRQGKLPDMQMLKQTRLSVSKVGQKEYKFLCDLADEKAKAAGLEHEI